MAGGRERSPSAYLPTPPAKRCRSGGGGDDARYAGASPKRRRGEDGEMLNGASAVAAPPSSRSRERERGRRSSLVARGGGCDYYSTRTYGGRSISHSRLDRRGSARGGGGGDEIREGERQSGNSSHGDHARWDHPAGNDRWDPAVRLDQRGSGRGGSGSGDEIWGRERRSINSSNSDHARPDHPTGNDRWDPAGNDPLDRHRDSTSSQKHSTSATDGNKRKLRFGNISIDVGRKIRSHEEMKKGTSFGQEEEHERYKKKIRLTILQQQDDAHGGQVEVESVPSSKNVKAGATTSTDTGKAVLLQNSTSASMANSRDENKQDSQVVVIKKANIIVGKPPAANYATGSGRPPVAAVGSIQKSGKPGGSHNERNVHPDNWDDVEGYYAYRIGEMLGGRYEITTAHEKGVFSTVVGAKDLEAGTDGPERVAVKIIRNNDTMYKTGKQEVSILEKLNGADRDGKRHCVRFISSFRYRNHLCLVFESLHMNLREVLKKFGRDIGLRLSVVKMYATQMFIALKHLKTCKVLHCDIKLDNVMVNQDKNVLKLCDFGSAMLAGMNEVTPYLVSRFYRAPEIIIGLPYDHPLDMWSVGCCLYELCTGKVLFQGNSNNEMLQLHMELKGPFPKKMLRSGAFTMQHFDRDLRFQDIHDDPIRGKVVRRLILNIKPKGIGSYISNIPKEDPKTVSCFKDILDKMFVLDPAKRITVEEALTHPFIAGK